jgi:hypothetical protein
VSSSIESEVQDLKAENARLTALIREARDLIQWMSGSSDFNPEGCAGTAWRKKGPDLLNRMESI